MNFGTGLSQIGWQEAELRAFLGLPGWRSRPVAWLGLFLASPGWDGDPVARLGSPGWRPVANQYPERVSGGLEGIYDWINRLDVLALASPEGCVVGS